MSKKEVEKRTNRISMYLTRRELDILLKKAGALGISRNELLCRAVVKYLPPGYTKNDFQF